MLTSDFQTVDFYQVFMNFRLGS